MKISRITKALLSQLVGSLSLIVCTCILFSFFGKYWWAFELTSHFRIQYFWSSLALIVLLILFKRKALAATLGLLAIANLIAIFPHIALNRETTDAEKGSISAMLINVNTQLGSPEKVSAYVGSINPDFLILQEISDQWLTDLSKLNTIYPYRAIETREDNFGIGLYSKHPFTSKSITKLGDSSIPYIRAQIAIGVKELNIITAHTLPPKSKAHAKSRNAQLKTLATIARIENEALLLIGDLNITPFSNYFEEFKKHSGLIDTSDKFGIQATWPSFMRLLGIQVDHVLYSDNVEVTEKSIGPRVGSDHYPVLVRFNILGN